MKVFISADIEGIAATNRWAETIGRAGISRLCPGHDRGGSGSL